MTHAQYTVGIASLWHNATELLPEFVRLMSKARWGRLWDQLILVNNASTSEAHAAYEAAVAYLGPQATVLRMETNSVLHGWNAGIAALDTHIVIQMANDVTMTDERWLEWGLDGVGPGIMQGPVVWHRGFPYIDGCMLVAMKADWQQLGGLDAEYYAHPGYWSDVDLCYRALRSGIKVRPCRSGIHHIVNYSGGHLPPYLEANQQNAIKFVNRYLAPLWEQRPVIWQDVPRSAPDVHNSLQR